jgi:hypothetical protein
MSGKYVFSQALKEVRFLFCQTGEHSGATRSVSFTSSFVSRNPHSQPLLVLVFIRVTAAMNTFFGDEKEQWSGRVLIPNTDLSLLVHTQP